MAKKKTHIYQQLNLKNQLSKQDEQRQNYRWECFDVCQRGGELEENGWRGEGIKRYK